MVGRRASRKNRLCVATVASAVAVVTLCSGFAGATSNDVIIEVDAEDLGIFLPVAASEKASEKSVVKRKKSAKENNARLLVLKANVANSSDSQTNIEALDFSGQYFLSFDSLIKLFGLPIEIDIPNALARGYIGEQENTFFLDFGKNTVALGKETSTITNNQIRQYDNRFFIHTETASQWFGITSKISKDKKQCFLEINKKLNQKPSLDDKQQKEYAFSNSLGEKDFSNSSKPKTSSGKNWSKFSVVQGHQTLGTVEAYIDLNGTYLRLDSILDKLGFSYQRGESPEVMNVFLKDGRILALNLSRHEYLENGHRHSLYYNDAIINGEEIFANIGLLERMLPDYQFVDNLAGRKIHVYERKGKLFGFFGEWTDKTDLAPTPLSAPVEPVIIDDLSGMQRTSGALPLEEDKKPEAGDVLHQMQLAEVIPTKVETPELSEKKLDLPTVSSEQKKMLPESPPDHAPGASVTVPVTEAKIPVEQARAESKISKGEEKKAEAEPLILQPRIKNRRPGQEFIEALDFSGQVFVPLNDLIKIMEFPIHVDSKNKTASGFIFSPENEFFLDLGKKTVRSGKESHEITASEAFVRDEQIYVNTASFDKWFGMKSEIDRGQSSIHFMTDKKFPQEEREERQAKWQKLMARTEDKTKQYPVLQNSYAAISYPFLDVNLGSSYTHSRSSSGSESNKRSYAANYNIQGSADIAYMTGQFYAQGATDGGPVNTIRFQAGRKDPDGNLLGGLGATEFSLGDITSPSINLVTSNSLGRGFSVSNKELNTPENFDFRNFSGDAVPGYEVELYRNNVLVAFQTVDGKGRYNFENVPILYGENDFRLVFYGPQGQREEKVESVSASSSLLRKNQFVYTLAADERGADLIPVGKKDKGNPRMPVGLQAVGGIRYGLTQDVTLGAALSQTKLSDGDHRYVTANAGSNIEGVLTDMTFARDMTNGGWAGSVAALGGLRGISLRAKYRKFNNFISEAVNNTETPLSSDARLDANTQLLLPVIGNYGLGLSVLRETFDSSSRIPRYTYGWRSSKSIWGLTFTNTADYIVDEQKRFQNTFGVQTRLWNISFRALGIYDFKPENKFRDATFMAQYRLLDRLSAQSQIDKNVSGDGKTTYGQNLNWDFDKFRLSFNGQVDSEKTFFAGLNILFSINHDAVGNRWRTQPKPTSGGGSIAGRVYIDENSNSMFDEGEKYVPDAKVKVNRVNTELSDGSYFVAPIAPYELSQVELNPASVKDPLLAPTAPGYQVMVRPGSAVIADFPLVKTTVIDGTVLLYDENGNKTEISDIVVELSDKNGKPLRREISALDGYFSFDKVPAGEYWLTIPEEALSAYGAEIESRIHIDIKEIEDFITGKNIILRRKPQTHETSPLSQETVSENKPLDHKEKEKSHSVSSDKDTNMPSQDNSQEDNTKNNCDTKTNSGEIRPDEEVLVNQ